MTERLGESPGQPVGRGESEEHGGRGPGDVQRRRFLLWLGWGGLAALAGEAAQTLVRFFRPAVLYTPAAAFRAGYPEDYAVGAVSMRWQADHRLWVIRSEKGLYALRAVCTHLGCTPRWSPGERVFHCPCHGSVFTAEGDVVGGPAPRGLDRLALGTAPDGQILIDTARMEHRPVWRDGEEFLLRL